VRIRAMNKPRDILDEWVVEAREVFGDVTVMDSMPAAFIDTTRVVPKKEAKPRVKKTRRKSNHDNQGALI
jgi:hypothetical protein